MSSRPLHPLGPRPRTERMSDLPSVSERIVDAWIGRLLEQARTQPGREFDPCRGPHSGGVAEDLNEPVWLWPYHTMRTSAKEWPVAEHFGCHSNERNGEVRCAHHHGN
jgi:hypothetical protein